MMSSTNEEDPFLQVQQDVLAQLQSTRPLFTSYLRIRSLLSASPQSPELVSARSDLESALQSLAEDLSDLIESVKAVESDPQQYGLSPTEIARRKRLVQEVGGEVEDMRDELAKVSNSTTTTTNNNNNNNSSNLPDPSSFNISGGDNEDYAAQFEQEQQVMMMREQDEHLDGVFQTVGNLRRQADDMGRELEQQREMLEVVDELTERVGGRIQTGMEKMKYIMRRSEDRWSSCCIGVLIVVLIVLLILLLLL